MIRTLILTRHAKSSWDDPFMNDHDRPLNKRGRKSAPAIGDWLRENGWLPDEVISSTATAHARDVGQDGAGRCRTIRFTRNLYHADPDDNDERPA